MRIEWGTKRGKALTGAHLCVRIFQVASLLPLPYIFAVAGYPAVITSRNVLSILFDAGIMAIPRVEALALSLIYRATMNEMAVYFALLVVSLAAGFTFGKLLRSEGGAALRIRRAFAAFLAADLVLRLLPLGFNTVFGLPAAALGALCEAACLAFLILDLRSAERND